MAHKSKAGSSLPPYSIEVERVKIRELVDAIGDENLIYRSRPAALAEGYRDVPCPPTFITLAFQEFTGFYLKVLDELGIPLVRAVHGEEEYEYVREIYPGDTLTIQAFIESIVEKQSKAGSLHLVTLRTEVINQRSELVMKTRSLLVERR